MEMAELYKLLYNICNSFYIYVIVFFKKKHSYQINLMKIYFNMNLYLKKCLNSS